jgi:hypothetical protein
MFSFEMKFQERKDKADTRVALYFAHDADVLAPSVDLNVVEFPFWAKSES